jgi:hypothetical protein
MTKKQTKKKTSKKYPKLLGRAHELAGKFIAEEVRAGYPQKQAVAIGISRARSAAKKTKVNEIARKYL